MAIVKKYATKNIFISSTFLDMQVERDVLAKKVLPLVKEYALKYHVNIEFVDLRFGIDIGNQNLLDKVINTCSDEIVRCKPLFIGFLGNRFGTEIEGSKESITSFEIHKAILEKCESLFYFRTITNQEALKGNKEKYIYRDEKVQSLKEEIIDIYPNSYREYTSFYDEEKEELILSEEFIGMLVEDINELIKKMYDREPLNTLSPHLDYLSFLYKDYIDIDEGAEYFLSKLFLFKEKILLILGRDGSGKSSLVSNLVKEYEKEALIFPFFTNVDDNHSLMNLINSYIEMIKIRFKEPYEYINNLEEAIKLFYQSISQIKEKCLIIIDDFYYINGEYENEKYSWIKEDEIPNNVRIVISTSSGVDVEHLEAESYLWRCIGVTHRMIKKYLDGYLEKINQKVSQDFYHMLLDELVNKCLNKSITYLKTYLDYVFFNDRYDAKIINELSNHDSESNLTSVDKGVLDFYINKIKNIKNFEDLFYNLLTKKVEMLDKELGKLILYLFAIFRNGVREKDLIGICELLNIKYVSNEFALLRKIMSSYFYQQKDGTWIITNDLVKGSLKEYCLKDKEYSLKVNKVILTYLKSLEDNDCIKLENIMPLLYQNKDCDEIKRLLLYAVYSEKPHYFDKFILDVCYSYKDYDLLLDILEGYSYKKQEEINCYLSNVICSNPYLDYDSYMEVLPYEIETRSVSNSRGIRYFFAYYNLKLCLLNDNDQHLDVLNEEFYDLYCSTKNEKMKQSIIECYFEMIELAKNKMETKKIINSLFKLLNLDSSIDNSLNKCKAYIEYMKLNKNNKEKTLEYLSKVEELVLEGYSSYQMNNEVIELLYKLCLDYIINENYFEVNKYLKLMKALINKYRYLVRSGELLQTLLIIEFLELISKYKLNNLKVEEVDDLWERFDELDRVAYEKELEISCSYCLRGVEVLKALVKKDYINILSLINSLAYQISYSSIEDKEIYILGYFVNEHISLIKEGFVVVNDEDIKKFKKRTYKLLRKREYNYDFFIKKIKKEIKDIMCLR